MAKRGFSLAELMVALLLASLLSLSLFQLLNQSRRIVRLIVNVIEVDEPRAAFYQQFEKDVIGMFAPQSSIEAYAQQDKQAEEAKRKAQGAQQAPPQNAQQGPPQKKEEAAEKTVPIQPVFSFESVSDTGFGFWSFITTGGIQVLNAQGEVEPTPFVRRVAYILEPDPQNPSLRRLMYRFSKDKLNSRDIRGPEVTPSYELLRGIKAIAFEFTLIEVVEKKEDAAKQAPTTPKTEIVKVWNEADIWKKYKALIPAYVKVSGTVVDASRKEYPFELFLKVPAYTPYKPKEESLAQRIERIATDIFGKKP